MGPDAAAGPYAAVGDLLDSNVYIRSAVNIVANHFPGVNPMDLLRCDDLEWQVWKSMIRCSEAVWAERAAQAKNRGG